MKAIFRIKIGKGIYLAIFKRSIIAEYYDSNDSMFHAIRIIGK